MYFKGFTRYCVPPNFWSVKTENTPQIFCKTFIKWIYPAKTLKLHYGNTTLNISVTEFWKKNLYWENILVFIAFQRVRIIGNYPGHRKYLEHKTLLNKSISLFWCDCLFPTDPKYFFLFWRLQLSVYTLGSIYHYLNKMEKLFKLTHRMQYAQKRQEQIISRHNRPLYLTTLPPNSNILQTITNTDENILCKAQTFSI